MSTKIIRHAKSDHAGFVEMQAKQEIRSPFHYARALARRLLRWHNRRKGIADLTALPDYMLKDIGISRSEIEAFASGVGRLDSRADPYGR